MGNCCGSESQQTCHSPRVTNRYSHDGRHVSRGQTGSLTLNLRSKYGIIPDSFESIEQVQEKLREIGLESSDLIVGVDFTKSNEWTGKHTFHGRSLHAISPPGGLLNPYEQAIAFIGQTLAPFDEDNLIPCYGFGDVSTHDTSVFSFNAGNRACNGFEEALQRYRAIAPNVHLSGPTSFAPVIETAVRIVEESGGQYHVLLLIADGQVTRSVDQSVGSLSQQEQATVAAIVAASHYPLSIVMVGVGDGLWDMMNEFDDALPQRNFDNFQFVPFSQLQARNPSPAQLATSFALAALMEVPFQYKACGEMGLIGKRTGCMPPTPPKEPPLSVLEADAAAAAAAPATAATLPPQFNLSAPSNTGVYTYALPGMNSVAMGCNGRSSTNPSVGKPPASAAPAVAASKGNECPICMTGPRNMAFQCGHQTCADCGKQVHDCPICRAKVHTRIKLYD